VAYRFKGRRAVARQLKRVVAGEFEKALEAMDGSPIANRPEAVHEARKSVKKIRPSCACSTELAGNIIAFRTSSSGLSCISCHRSAMWTQPSDGGGPVIHWSRDLQREQRIAH